jgi:hypothetical protein
MDTASGVAGLLCILAAAVCLAIGSRPTPLHRPPPPPPKEAPVSKSTISRALKREASKILRDPKHRPTRDVIRQLAASVLANDGPLKKAAPKKAPAKKAPPPGC